MKHKHSQKILRILSITAGVLLLSGLLTTAHAAAPMAKTQVPGYYRMMLGQFEITALADGFSDMDVQRLRNVTEAKIKSVLDRNFLAYPTVKTPVNAFLINTGTSLVLVDAGGGQGMGPGFGNVIRNMKAAGYDPAQVDAVLISHMHRDHVGGLLDSEGKPAFPNAFVFISKAENDAWLSPAEAEKAPPEMKRYFKMARDAADPYIALGRWQTFESGHFPIASIKVVPIPGHTAGHSAFEVKSGSDTLLIISDMVHNMAVQSALPAVAISFDNDQKQAVTVRQTLFKSAAKSKVLIAGMHIPFPGIGHLRAESDNSYTWVPIQFAPLPTPEVTPAKAGIQ